MSKDNIITEGKAETRGGSSRRSFFKKFAGVTAAAGVASGCDSLFDLSDDEDSEAVELDFSDDFGVLNYAYALEQLEAAFYAQVSSSIGNGELSFKDDETDEYFNDIAAHEAIHRDFLKAGISANGGEPLPALEVDFSSVKFSDTNSVLQTAKTFEDLGVSAYNGAGKLLSSATFLTLAGKIVSVEARHASAIRAIIEPKSENFADLSELSDFGASPAKGYDAAQSPTAVLKAADPFIATPLAIRNLDM